MLICLLLSTTPHFQLQYIQYAVITTTLYCKTLAVLHLSPTIHAHLAMCVYKLMKLYRRDMLAWECTCVRVKVLAHVYTVYIAVNYCVLRNQAA
jgi:hypothetical protein